MEVLAFITVGIGALPLGGDDVSDEATAEDLAAATATAATELAAVLATVQQLDTVAAQAVTSGLSALFGLMSASDGSPSSASASEQISAAVEQMARAATAAALATTAVPSSGIAEPVVLSSPNLNMTINVRSASALAAEPISCDSGTGVAAAVSVPTDLINVIPGLDQSVPVAAVLHTSRVNLHGGLGGSGAAERRRQRRRRRLTSESMSPGHPAGNGTAAGPTISIKISQQGTELVVKDAATPIIISLAYQSPAAAAGRLPCVGRPDSLSDAARACATTVECRFWNETEDSWSTNGCATTMGADGSVGCSCTHLTEFIAFEFPTTVEELREVALGAVAFVSLESSAFECALDPARSWRTVRPIWYCLIGLVAMLTAMLAYGVRNDRRETYNTLLLLAGKKQQEQRLILSPMRRRAKDMRTMMLAVAGKRQQQQPRSVRSLLPQMKIVGYLRAMPPQTPFALPASATNASPPPSPPADKLAMPPPADETAWHLDADPRCDSSAAEPTSRLRSLQSMSAVSSSEETQFVSSCGFVSSRLPRPIKLRTEAVRFEPVVLYPRPQTVPCDVVLYDLLRSIENAEAEPPNPTRDVALTRPADAVMAWHALGTGMVSTRHPRMSAASPTSAIMAAPTVPARARSVILEPLSTCHPRTTAASPTSAIMAAPTLPARARSVILEPLKASVGAEPVSERSSSEERDFSPEPSFDDSMEPELHDLLAGVNPETCTILGDNDICSVDDVNTRSSTDLDKLGIKVGVGYKIIEKTSISDPVATPSSAAACAFAPKSSTGTSVGADVGADTSSRTRKEFVSSRGFIAARMPHPTEILTEAVRFEPVVPYPRPRTASAADTAAAPSAATASVLVAFGGGAKSTGHAATNPPQAHLQVKAPSDGSTKEISISDAVAAQSNAYALATLAFAPKRTAGPSVGAGAIGVPSPASTNAGTAFRRGATSTPLQRWKQAQAKTNALKLTKRWHKDVDSLWKRVCLGCTAKHSLCAGILTRGLAGFTRAQTMMLLFNGFAFELVMLCLLYSQPTPLAVDNVTGLPQEEAGPAVVINPVAIIISATLTAVICIPVGLIFGWVFDPIILVNVSKNLLWLILCWPYWLVWKCVLKRHWNRSSSVVAPAPQSSSSTVVQSPPQRIARQASLAGRVFSYASLDDGLLKASLTFTWKNKDWASVRKILLGWTLSLMLFAIMCFTFVLYGCQLFEPQDWVGDDGGGDNNSSVGSNDGLAVVRTIPLIKQAGNPVELIISWLLSCFQRFVLLEPSLILANKGLPMLFASAFCANCCGNAIIESVSLLFVIMTEFVKSMSN